MKVLVVGASSAIARIVVDSLLEAGHEVEGLDLRGWEGAPIEVYTVDICKRAAEDIFRRMRPDAVVCTGSTTTQAGSEEDRHSSYLQGTRAVFEHCRAYGVGHCVFVGRHTFYGAASDSPLFHTEDEPPMAPASFPELADLVAADLYASSALWRFPGLRATVLRISYFLGASGRGTLAARLRGARIPTVLGFDPLIQFMHERDAAAAIILSLEAGAHGVFNVVGPDPIPISTLLHETGRRGIPVPEPLFMALRGRLGLPRIPDGAMAHMKFPVVADGAAFARATGFRPRYELAQAMIDFWTAFPPPVAIPSVPPPPPDESEPVMRHD